MADGGGGGDEIGRGELLVVLVISLTAVLTAWTTFQSAKWSGEQTLALSEAGAARSEAETSYSDARALFVVDVQVFEAWLSAVVREEDDIAEVYEELFPPTLEEAFDEWMEEDPFTNPDAPLTPFDEYVYELDDEGDELAEEAEELREEAAEANQRSDDYTAMTVLFATVILFAALSDKLRARRSQRVLLGLAVVGLVAGAATLATFPIVL